MGVVIIQRGFFSGTSGVILGVIICLGLFMVHGCKEKQPLWTATARGIARFKNRLFLSSSIASFQSKSFKWPLSTNIPSWQNNNRWVCLKNWRNRDGCKKGYGHEWVCGKTEVLYTFLQSFIVDSIITDWVIWSRMGNNKVSH